MLFSFDIVLCDKRSLEEKIIRQRTGWLAAVVKKSLRKRPKRPLQYSSLFSQDPWGESPRGAGDPEVLDPTQPDTADLLAEVFILRQQIT